MGIDDDVREVDKASLTLATVSPVLRPVDVHTSISEVATFCTVGCTVIIL